MKKILLFFFVIFCFINIVCAEGYNYTSLNLYSGSYCGNNYTYLSIAMDGGILTSIKSDCPYYYLKGNHRFQNNGNLMFPMWGFGYYDDGNTSFQNYFTGYYSCDDPGNNMTINSTILCVDTLCFDLMNWSYGYYLEPQEISPKFISEFDYSTSSRDYFYSTSIFENDYGSGDVRTKWNLFENHSATCDPGDFRYSHGELVTEDASCSFEVNLTGVVGSINLFDKSYVLFNDSIYLSFCPNNLYKIADFSQELYSGKIMKFSDGFLVYSEEMDGGPFLSGNVSYFENESFVAEYDLVNLLNISELNYSRVPKLKLFDEKNGSVFGLITQQAENYYRGGDVWGFSCNLDTSECSYVLLRNSTSSDIIDFALPIKYYTHSFFVLYRKVIWDYGYDYNATYFFCDYNFNCSGDFSLVNSTYLSDSGHYPGSSGVGFGILSNLGIRFRFMNKIYYESYGNVTTLSDLSYPLGFQVPPQDCNKYAVGCFDGILNQDETDIDYGGVCGSCGEGLTNATDHIWRWGRLMHWGEPFVSSTWCEGLCNDGVLNQNETEIDYGGICGSCGANLTKATDVNWVLWRTAYPYQSFDSKACAEGGGVAGIVIIILIIVISVVFFLLFLLLGLELWPILIVIWRTYRYLTRKKDDKDEKRKVFKEKHQ
jgi:hypothetical protein